MTQLPKPRGRPKRPVPPPVPPPVDTAAPADSDTESRILDAARRVFMKRGTAGARMQEIAAEAGVNQALLHYYFGSKDQLAERVFLDAAGTLVRALAPIINPSATFEETLERFIGGYIDTIRQSPFIPAYMLAEAHQQPERLNTLMRKAVGTVPAEIASATMTRVRVLISERVKAGTMRPISPQQLLINVMSMTVFPFVARPVLSMAFGFTDESFDRFLDDRKRELPAFILNALRP
jgi:TetR/AcrR family transcriptional regulator